MRKKFGAVLICAMMVCVMTACENNSSFGENFGSNKDSMIGYPEDGYADGYLGDTMHTVFFDFTINSAYRSSEFDTLIAVEGYRFLEAEITLKNTSEVPQPMYFWDFQIEWDAQPGETENETYGFPLYEEVQDKKGESEFVSISQQQLPTYYTLDVGETRTGILLYMVPEGSSDYVISFEEYLENEELGDSFYVWFNAEDK